MGSGTYTPKTEYKPLKEASVENINTAIVAIGKFASEKGYVMSGGNVLVGLEPQFRSNQQRKTVRLQLTKLAAHITMRSANRFLHLIFRHIYHVSEVPKVEYSEREEKIRKAKQLWKASSYLAQIHLKEYKELKGDFYKKKADTSPEVAA